MPLTLSENFNNDTNSYTVLLGTWQLYSGYLRMTQWVVAEPQAVVVFQPGDDDFKYNDPTVDPPVRSFAQFKIAAQEDEVAAVGFWLLAGSQISGHSATVLTTRPDGIRARYWTGTAMTQPSGWDRWTPSCSVGDVIRAEIIGNERRVGLNGDYLGDPLIDDLLLTSGWHGIRIPHGSANSGADDWQMGPLSSFTLT